MSTNDQTKKDQPGGGVQRFAPEQMTVERPHDYVEWMDAPDITYFDEMSPDEQQKFLDSLPEDKRVKFAQAAAESAAPDPEQ